MTSLDGQERPSDLLEVSLVLCWAVASSRTGGHNEDGFRRPDSAPIPKHVCCEKKDSDRSSW